MKNLILIFLLPLSLSAQSKYWISFSNKGGQAINTTEVSLSERALERRNRQNISISVSDLPVLHQTIYKQLKTLDSKFLIVLDGLMELWFLPTILFWQTV